MAGLTQYQDDSNRESEGSAVVIIGGARYDRFLSLSLKNNVNQSTCEGTIVLSWPGAEQFNIAGGLVAQDWIDGADGIIMLDGQLAATIRFDTRISKGSPTHYELTLHFRGQCSTAVDSMPDHPTGQQNNITPKQGIEALLQGTGIAVVDHSGSPAPFPRFIHDEGAPIDRLARRLARERGLQLFENPLGNWVLIPLGESLGAGSGDLVVGQNIQHWSVTRNLGPRQSQSLGNFHGIPNDQTYGKPVEEVWSMVQRQLGVSGVASNRKLVHNRDEHHTPETAEIGNNHEMDSRSQQGLNVTVRMTTFSDKAGQLWSLKHTYHTVIRVDGVDDDLELQEVTYELTPDSRSATLVLVAKQGGSAGAVVDGGEQVRSQEDQQAQEQANAMRQIQEGQTPPPLNVGTMGTT